MSFNVILGQPDGVAFTVFGLDIMWYALCLVSGIIAGTYIAYLRCPRYGIDKDRFLDLILYCVPAAVIGSRLYYVAFEWGRYKDKPLEIFNIRGGGLAIHGALLFGIGLGLILIKKWKLKPLNCLDLVAPGLAMGQALGRWGNYFNQEAHGVHTDLPWAIAVNGDTVHPTFLYESAWCLLLCVFLLWYEKKGKHKFPGRLLLLYIILYSVERFFVEGLRTDSLMIGPLRQAQVISLCAVAAALLLWKPLEKRGGGESADIADGGESSDITDGGAD